MADTPLDQTVPGGHYLAADGTAHDAHGRALTRAEPVDYAAMKAADLHALAEQRGVAVSPADGKGAPLKADYVAALEQADAQAAG